MLGNGTIECSSCMRACWLRYVCAHSVGMEYKSYFIKCVTRSGRKRLPHNSQIIELEMDFISSTLLDEKKFLQARVYHYVCVQTMEKRNELCVQNGWSNSTKKCAIIIQRLAFAYFARNNYLKTLIANDKCLLAVMPLMKVYFSASENANKCF